MEQLDFFKKLSGYKKDQANAIAGSWKAGGATWSRWN